MRYFLDTEFNGHRGALLSLALVPDDGEEFYVTLQCADPPHAWVERHVIPFLDMVPPGMQAPRLSHVDAAQSLSAYLIGDPAPEIVADWPEDIALLSALLVTGPAMKADVPSLTFRYVALPGFSNPGGSNARLIAKKDSSVAESNCWHI